MVPRMRIAMRIAKVFEEESTRAKCIYVTILLVCSALLTGCDKAKGIESVERLCAKDGGERIFDTVYVGGFLYESSSSDDCRHCRYALGAHRLEETCSAR